MNRESFWTDGHDSNSQTREACAPNSSTGEVTRPAPTLIVSLQPNATQQSRAFDLLGQINYRILQGQCVYLRACGLTYKVLYSVYWRSVFSGDQHWGLKCATVEHGMWSEGHLAAASIELPLRFTKDGWIVEAESFQFLLQRDFPAFLNCPLACVTTAQSV